MAWYSNQANYHGIEIVNDSILKNNNNLNELIIVNNTYKKQCPKSETKDLISDKPAIRKETTVIRTYDHEISETTVSIKCSYLYPGFISTKIIISRLSL